jgi:hypothetical protein
MKKFTLSLLVIVSLFSCKEELPSNISTKLYFKDYHLAKLDTMYSIINSLSDDDISKLSKDSVSSLIFNYTYYADRYKEYNDELNDILKYNPEYSGHPDLLNSYVSSLASYKNFTDNYTKLYDKYLSID